MHTACYLSLVQHNLHLRTRHSTIHLLPTCSSRSVRVQNAPIFAQEDDAIATVLDDHGLMVVTPDEDVRPPYQVSIEVECNKDCGQHSWRSRNKWWPGLKAN